MITAGIDVGSNTVRLLIAEVSNGRIIKRLCSKRGITRLGAGLNATGQLSQESMDKTIALLEEFAADLDEYNVDMAFPVATSAVREASNGKEFLERAKRAGIWLAAIPGSKEAEYTYLGIASNMQELPKSAIIYDIGGGSTEFIYVKDGRVVADVSVPIGVVKLADKYGFDKPTEADTHRRCMSYIHEQLCACDMITNFAQDNATELIGTAGSVTTIAAVELGMTAYDAERINKHILTRVNVEKQLAMLAPMTAEQRIALPGLEAGREDLMIAGILMVLVIMDIFGSYESGISDNGLREGLAVAAEQMK
ncbi:MAG: hypothetical protein LBV04_09620 [Deferribacteraceae bacterium]|jgi:exopolyphosphatase/guanosine-5'-triphosphate,3'-diphosphate pyrophosphatase|nr:hypothetical protein [Deferribacteraceae bacterium]